MVEIPVEALTPYLGAGGEVVGLAEGRVVTSVRATAEADEDSLAWVSPARKDALDLVRRTGARVVICDAAVAADPHLRETHCLLVTKEPRLAFLRVVQAFFTPPSPRGVHATAFVHPEAVVAPDTWIGPFAYVGRCRVGEGTVLHGHCHLYDGVVLGARVTVHAGTVIGADGFGYQRNAEGELEKFPHVGGVVIEDDVEIGANTCIDRGTLGDTRIERGAKVDNLVHLAHNVVVGAGALVIADAMVGGEIGANATVGMGAVVTKSVPAGETWAGSPARPLPQKASAATERE